MRDRFFVEGVHAVGDRVAFAPDDARKLIGVLRKRSGDRVQVIDSGGAAYAATLRVEGRTVDAMLDAPLERRSAEPRVAITIAQAIPKGQKMDFVVEKATELGVATIVPVRSARVIGADTSAAKVERWRRIARAAAQQSGRLRIPEIADVHDWETLLRSFPRYDRVFIPWELAEPAPLRDVFELGLPRCTSVLFAIGPEGGFSGEEIERARDAGAVPISLGRRILRTETAGLVILSTAWYALGEI